MIFVNRRTPLRREASIRNTMDEITERRLFDMPLLRGRVFIECRDRWMRFSDAAFLGVARKCFISVVWGWFRMRLWWVFYSFFYMRVNVFLFNMWKICWFFINNLMIKIGCFFIFYILLWIILIYGVNNRSIHFYLKSFAFVNRTN